MQQIQSGAEKRLQDLKRSIPHPTHQLLLLVTNMQTKACIGKNTVLESRFFILAGNPDKNQSTSCIERLIPYSLCNFKFFNFFYHICCQLLTKFVVFFCEVHLQQRQKYYHGLLSFTPKSQPLGKEIWVTSQHFDVDM